jgi:2,4-dienoyl-CoA reductase-like NADH-dependent reductase (Old Yellow Enzyme family)
MAAYPALFQPLILPCGATLPNRLAKSALSENLAEKGGVPGKDLFNLYENWGKGGAGLIITGNVMVDHKALGEAHNVIVEDETHLDVLKHWTSRAQANGSPLWMQINHPGRQAIKLINKDVVAPSAIPIKGKMLFATPRPLEEDEILEIIDRFGNTALIAKKAGFSGVQIHGAHGYLISQFLSPLANQRSDKWGGSLENRMRFVLEVYQNIRRKVGDDFPVGIKINSADFQRGGFTEEESMEVISTLSSLKIDLIEISGGIYEKAAMMGYAQKESTRQREAYFAEYVIKARARISAPLMLTGGFRTAAAMESAIQNKEVDIIGLGRPFCLYPHLAKEIADGLRTECPIAPVKTGISQIDNLGFLDTLWHEEQLKLIAHNGHPDPSLSPWKVIGKMGLGMMGV